MRQFPQVPADIEEKRRDRHVALIEHAIATLIMLHRQAIAPLPCNERQHQISENVRQTVFLLIDEKLDRERILGKATRQLQKAEYEQRLYESSAPLLLEELPPPLTE